MHYVNTTGGMDLFVQSFDNAIPTKPTPEHPMLIHINGTLFNACICAAIRLLYGKECLVGISVPYLETENPQGTQWIQDTLCHTTKTIPVTMPIVDLCNELQQAGVCIDQKSGLDAIYDHMYMAVMDVLYLHGYIPHPTFEHSSSEDVIRSLAVELGIPTELFPHVFYIS